MRQRHYAPTAGLFLSALCSLSLPVASQQRPATVPNHLTSAVDHLCSERFSADAPGAAVIVVKDGKTVFRKA